MRHARWVMLATIPVALALGGCKTEHKVEHEIKGNEPVKAEIEVKPIHITVDVNVRVKVDKELDEFFDFQGGDPVAPADDPLNGVKAEPVNP